VTQGADLPYVDEHTTVIAASAEDVWAALLETLERAFSRPPAASYARLVGCAVDAASGPRPLAAGSSIPGFTVVTAEPRSRLVLAGRHRFSTYGLTFRIDHLGAQRTRLSAESRAAFPGAAGRGYRLLVIGTGAHAVLMRRLLSGVRRAAERATSSQAYPEVETAD
jgi:hypothetical protein